MYRFNKPSSRRASRRGLTLVELLIAIAVLALTTVALGALTQAVKITTSYTAGTSAATQHARVALWRIDAAVSAAFANEQFPGAIVFAETIGSYNYPDTLVVWHPDGTSANPAGLPLFSEIVVFCPNPSVPNQLLEITSPGDTRTVPAIDNLAAWATELASLKSGPTSDKVLLTDLVRTATPSSGSTTSRGAVRFAVELRPTAAAWASFRAGTLAFDDLAWTQSIFGSQTGLRQTWVSSELQLMPTSGGTASAPGTPAIPFFGSAALYWTLPQ